jgi:hypothetical protein
MIEVEGAGPLDAVEQPDAANKPHKTQSASHDFFSS